MKRNAFSAVVGLLATSISAAALAQAPSVPPGKANNPHAVYRFVGFSENQTAPDRGLVQMHFACQSSFGDSARMCTTKEIFETPDFEGKVTKPGPFEGWAHPVIVSEIFNSLDGVITLRDFSGLTVQQGSGFGPASLSCAGWTRTGKGIFGAVFDGLGTGAMKAEVCSSFERSVACCAPQ